MNTIEIIFIILFTIFAALGSYFFKISAKKIKGNWLVNWFIYMGIASYALSNLFFILALKNNNLSFIIPFAGITYIWTLLIAKNALKEKITMAKMIAVGLIIIGITIINLKF